MSTKIIVIQLREIIYTAIFVGLGIFLIFLLIFMFSPKKNDATTPTMTYIPGVYTSSMVLENQAVNVEVRVNENEITSVKIVDLHPAVETLYPLLQPSLEHISSQLTSNTDVAEVTFNADHKYTSSLIMDAIKNSLEKAQPDLHTN
ncbi:uncharacterized protein with FMN-binding domain [Natranaerovirga pectinivora]|uniref:Uncharacterized protein with FMN-binding domain n=1 Tax=Natranaerovirga pectinivora TaxID=682400 RepID=A0A4R3MKU6_9FIRM|nr:hypothetical protein [Natranaerovirga pectinivora]TCT14333.1 uncharacterized protein with FMN-binding domain [Natranaerovirga pectinivora]